MKIITRAEAKARGLKRYFTGEPCKHGHRVERATRGAVCFECNRLRMRRYRNGSGYLRPSMAVCVECSVEFEVSNKGRIPVFCSWHCRETQRVAQRASWRKIVVCCDCGTERTVKALNAAIRCQSCYATLEADRKRARSLRIVREKRNSSEYVTIERRQLRERMARLRHERWAQSIGADLTNPEIREVVLEIAAFTNAVNDLRREPR